MIQREGLSQRKSLSIIDLFIFFIRVCFAPDVENVAVGAFSGDAAVSEVRGAAGAGYAMLFLGGSRCICRIACGLGCGLFGGKIRSAKDHFFRLRDEEEQSRARNGHQRFGEHIGAVVEEGVDVGVHVDGSPDGYAGDVVAYEAEEDGEEGADEDAFGAFVFEESGYAEDGEGEDVVGEDADDEDDGRETPAEDSSGED